MQDGAWQRLPVVRFRGQVFQRCWRVARSAAPAHDPTQDSIGPTGKCHNSSFVLPFLDLTSVLRQYQYTVATTACPILGMAMSGTSVLFYAVYYADKVYGTRLCQFILDGDTKSEDVAGFQVMRNTGRMLREYYTNLHTGCVYNHTPQLLPQPLSIISCHASATPESIAQLASLNLILLDRVPDSGQLKFLSQRSLFRGTVKMVGSARIHNVYVKFVKNYGTEAHSFLASHEPPFAPRILFCGEVLPELTMVVMEDLQVQGGIDIATCVSRGYDVVKDIQPLAEEALSVLHAAGFVHGDLRAPNIVVRPGARRVYFIDFDWAGEEGVASYPVVLNTHINWIWSAEYLEGERIMKCDDEYMLRQTLDKSLKDHYIKAGTLGKRLVGSDGEDGGPSKRSRNSEEDDDEMPPSMKTNALVEGSGTGTSTGTS